jgi:esterase/lipase superfamily enzyme
MIARIIALAFCLALTACASVKRPDTLTPVAMTVPDARMLDLFVATTRGLNRDSGQFSDTRAKHLSFQSLRLSIPPAHKAGNIEWPATLPGNPATDFVTLSNDIVDQGAFLRRVEARLPASGEVFVFVHGYNTNHEDAIFRLAQMAHDAGLQPVPIAFTWPSRGSIRDYVTDRESSMAARNRLEELLVLLSRSPRIRGINLFAHSMGGMLTVETLAQAKLRGNGEFGGKLDAVVLASPDIDVDVFLSQFEIIGKRPRPTIILTSKDDKALRISRSIAGDVVRVGAASPRDPASVAAIHKYGFTVIDMTGTQTADNSNHTKFANSPKFLQMLGTGLNQGLQKGGSGVGAFIADAAGDILDVPGKALREIAGQ